MRNRISSTIQLLSFNWRTLLTFEILYRLVGLAIIFPIANQLLYYSVKVTGHEYLLNSTLIEYIKRPSTIAIVILISFIIGIYITFEIIVLSLLFHSCHFQKKIGLFPLIIASVIKMKTTLLRYHIVIISSSMIFLIIVEGLHLVGIASTLEMPVILQELIVSKWSLPTFVIFILMLSILFFETLFFEIQSTIEPKSISHTFIHSRRLLKKNRWKIFVELIGTNIGINTVFYIIYFIVIGLVAFFLLFFREPNAIYAIVLTSLYTLYLIIGFLATIILIPINFAWINVWYYQEKTLQELQVTNDVQQIVKHKRFTGKIYNRIIGIASILLVIFVIFLLTSISNEPSHFELFNNPTVISHRGGGDFAPENTIGAIEKGIEFGADAVEIDVRFTKDGIPILIHDETLGRTTNDILNRPVDSLTLEEIQMLDAGSWFSEAFQDEPVPTLEEALDTAQFRIDIFLEIKTSYEGSDDLILDIIDRTNTQNQIKILSFNDNLLKSIKEKNEKIETVLLLSSFIGNIETLKNKTYIDHYGFKYSAVQNTTNRLYIRALQQAGKGVYVWTVNHEDTTKEMITYNVDGIITDTPILTRELIYSNSKKTIMAKLLETLFSRN